jgi:hypothetical protein
MDRTDQLKNLRDGLRIDEDDLDQCLIEQPSLFFNVADALALAISKRDETKLELDELLANKDRTIRNEAKALEEKITEAAIQRRLDMDKGVQDKQRDFADQRLKVDRLTALKEAYKERSWMLREIVASKIAHMQNLSIERGAHGVRRNLVDAQAESNYNAQSRMREERRERNRG